MPYFTKPAPDDDVFGLLATARQKWHGELDDAEVTIDVLFAWNRENEVHALKLHGWPCKATVKVVSYKERVRGSADALLTVSGPVWRGLSEDERLGLLDHELEHLVIARGRDNQAKRDDAGRPRLKCRPHDYELGGFVSVAKRHGPHAPEVQSFRDVYAAHRQTLLPWGDDNVAPDEIAGRIADVLSA